jgi:PAS domain S-box-containing protein
MTDRRQSLRKPIWYDLTVALFSVGAGFLTRYLLRRWCGVDAPYMGFMPWIIAAGIYAGSRAGIITVLGFAAAGAASPQATTLIHTRGPYVGLFLFVCAGGVIIAAIEWADRVRRRMLATIGTLRDSEERLRLSLEAGDMGTWEWTIASDQLAWSPGFARIHGGSLPGDRGKLNDALAAVNAEDRARLSSAIQDALAHCGDFRTEYRIATGGPEHWVEARGRVLCDAGGKPLRMVGVCMDISLQRQTEQNLRASQHRYQALAEAMPEFVWSCAADGRVEYVNPQYVNYTGVSVESVNTGGWQKIVHPDDLAAIWQRWNHSLATGEPFEMEYRFRRQSDGEFRWFLSRSLSVRDEGGKVIRWVGAATDIHDSKIMREERERLLGAERSAREEAERASQVKDQFLAMLSHELRTPLTPALMTVSLLEADEDLPADLREDVASIRRSVELEARLIDDLLDLTRLARGKIRYDFQPVNVHLLMQSAISICCGDQKHEVEVNLAARHSMVQADPARLQQVFWNLLNNAWKFTSPGGKIAIRTSDDEGKIRISVQDSGCGIEADLLPRVFDAFEQGDAIAARRFGGLGLGLAICKALVLAHGGAISVNSEGQGRGATFIVELPCISNFSANVRSAPPREPVRTDENRPLRMLLIEDHPETLKALTKLLSTCGHKVHGAACVAEGLQAAASEHYDLVISDLGLPDGTGFELMRELQQRHGLRGIALSGYGMEDDVARSLQAGFCEHLVKPVDVQKLREAIARVAITV